METPQEILGKMNGFREKDDAEGAAAYLQAVETKAFRDPDFHRDLARVCEDLGLIPRAVLQYNLSLRDLPEQVSLLKRLAVIYQDQGQPEKAVRVWQQVIPLAPQDEEPIYELGLLFEQNQEWEAARNLYQEAFERTKNLKFQKFLKELEFQAKVPPDRDRVKSTPEENLLSPTEAQLIHFTALFSGREAVYARQWVSPTGNAGYTPIQEPLTILVAKNHILGHHTIGVYQLRLDNTVNFIAFDIDIAKAALARGITDRKVWERQVKEAHGLACRLLDIAAAMDFPLYLEDSGFKGRHLWLFLERPIPAKAAKRFAEGLASQLPPPPAGVHLEIFPKQSYVAGEGLGNLIKLPLGIHRKTGRRGIFITPEGRAVENQLTFLDAMERIRKERIYEAIQRLYGSTSPPAAEKTQGGDIPPPQEFVVLRPEEEYKPDQDLPLQFLLGSCETLSLLTRKTYEEKELTNEERNVLTYVLGHLEKGPQAVNFFLSQTVNADSSMFLKSRFQGNPMSCPKIRSRIPHITAKANCNCQFDPRLNMYPTPLLHLQTLKSSGSLTADPAKLSAIKLQQIVREYIKIKGEMKRMQVLAEGLEKTLVEVFRQNEVQQIPTSMGTLKMLTSGEGQPSFIVEI